MRQPAIREIPERARRPGARITPGQRRVWLGKGLPLVAIIVASFRPPAHDAGSPDMPDRRNGGAEPDRGRRLRNRAWRWQIRKSGAATPQDGIFAQRVRDIHHLLNGEWIPDVLVVLSPGPQRYSVLLSSVRAKTDHDGWSGNRHRYLQESVLNRTLRRLEHMELVERHRESAFPYHTWYQLTPAAEELLMALVPVAEWSEVHKGLVQRARKPQQRRGNSG